MRVEHLLRIRKKKQWYFLPRNAGENYSGVSLGFFCLFFFGGEGGVGAGSASGAFHHVTSTLFAELTDVVTGNYS